MEVTQAITAVNEVMARLHVVQHPEKTFIGRIARGFDFSGYWFSPLGLGIAWKTVGRCAEKVSLLYVQGADVVRIGTYLGRWVAWVQGGVRWVEARWTSHHYKFTVHCSVGCMRKAKQVNTHA